MKLHIICTLGIITLASCEKRGDWDQPYEAGESVFTTPNDGNRSGYPAKGLQPSDAPGGATSPGVTSGGPSTMLDEGAGVPPMPPDPTPKKEEPADGGENESNAAGATTPGGGSSSTPTAGGTGTPQDAKDQAKPQQAPPKKAAE